MMLANVFLLLLIVYVDSADRKRLQMFPPGMKTFDLQKFKGKWYHYAATFNCSWRGARAFTNWYYLYTIEEKHKGFTRDSIWKKDGACTYTKSTAKMTSTACFDYTDHLGGIASGKRILVYTNYRNYAIMWACTKESVNRFICDDYSITVHTRHPQLNKRYLVEINMILYTLWGTSLAEMEFTKHSNPCERPATRTRKRISTY